MRVLVCGGRDFDDYDLMEKTLDQYQITTIIHGAARGADLFSDRYAAAKGLKREAYPANWNLYGNSAGPIRNQYMLESKPDLVIAFPGGRGTADMVSRAKKAGVEVVEISY